MTFVQGWNGSPRERFDRHLIRTLNGCLEWMGGTNPDGYGKLYLDGKTVATHRIAWENVNGPIPDGMLVLHSCDNPPCCELTHLRLGTVADNSADMVSRGRHRGQQKTHCVHGHEYTEENTSRGTTSGGRRCKSCHRIEARVANQRKRAMA